MKLKNKFLNYSIDCDPKFKKPNNVIIKDFCDIVFQTNKIFKANVSFIFCNDIFLSDLKKKYFNKNHYTDIITFRMNDIDEEKIEGEVYISLDRALENSKIYNEPYEKEIIRLVIHGCLHLMGFDDKKDKEKKNMSRLEESLLNKSDWSGLI